MFEPNGPGRQSLTAEAITLADILKVSEERIPSLGSLLHGTPVYSRYRCELALLMGYSSASGTVLGTRAAPVACGSATQRVLVTGSPPGSSPT